MLRHLKLAKVLRWTPVVSCDCLVLLVAALNPFCLSCLLVCAKEEMKEKKKVGSLDYQGNE